jgi:hypothetical protein
MCRSIKQLRLTDRQPTDEEIYAASLQFVRKISGYRQPSRRNEVAFNAAVSEISAAAERLLSELTPPVSAVQHVETESAHSA